MSINIYVGLEGKYNFLNPFDSYNRNTIYKCTSIRNITEMIADGKDVLNNIYKNNGLLQANYDEDVINQENIITLKNELGNWLILPSKYISSYPDISGIKYCCKALSVNLGALPVDSNLDPLMDSIRNIVFSYTGIISEITDVECSRIILVSKEDHERIENARSVLVDIKISDQGKIVKLENSLSSALDKISKLENYIKINHT